MLSFREHCQLDEVFTKPLPIEVTMRPQAWTAGFTVPASPDDPRGRWADKDYEVNFSQREGRARRWPATGFGLTIPKELNTSNVAWELTFQSDDQADSFGVTGTGQAFTVFATVIHALKVFVQKTRPRPFIVFTAKEASREKLYDRFVRMVKRAVPGMHGFKLINTPAVRHVLGNQLTGSAGLSSYVIVPTHISLKTVAKLIGVWHKDSEAATDEFLSSL
jgi:hypothetical protein